MARQASNPVPTRTPNHQGVIGTKFLTQFPVDFMIADDGSVTVNGTLVFSIEEVKPKGLHDRRHLKDADGDVLVTLKHKIRTLHERWQVFRGDSEDKKDLLFSVKKSSLWPKRTPLDVFLASNKGKSVPDFKIKGSKIYLGKSNVVIAQMFKDTDNFAIKLRVYPKVDYAFVVALVVGDKSKDGCSRSGQLIRLGMLAFQLGMGVAGSVLAVS